MCWNEETNKRCRYCCATCGMPQLTPDHPSRPINTPQAYALNHAHYFRTQAQDPSCPPFHRYAMQDMMSMTMTSSRATLSHHVPPHVVAHPHLHPHRITSDSAYHPRSHRQTSKGKKTRTARLKMATQMTISRLDSGPGHTLDISQRLIPSPYTRWRCVFLFLVHLACKTWIMTSYSRLSELI